MANARAPAGHSRPRYSEIEDILRGEIQAGVHKLGTRLPTEHELCQRFGVSRFTVRQALSRLREAGILDARPGIGTIVVSPADRVTFVYTLSSMEELLQYPAETYRRHIAVENIEASAEQAVMLRCDPGQDWVQLKAMRVARPSDAPISAVDAYVLPRFADVLDLPNPASPTTVVILPSPSESRSITDPSPRNSSWRPTSRDSAPLAWAAEEEVGFRPASRNARSPDFALCAASAG